MSATGHDDVAHGYASTYELSLKLAKLTGTLRIHFAQEDLSLYPEMLRSKDPAAAEAAATFQAEMGGLGAAFEAYANRWRSSKESA